MMDYKITRLFMEGSCLYKQKFCCKCCLKNEVTLKFNNFRF